ncbi:hypothetical protein PDESU_01798 [Pontiella desulfatans]|uniref:Uncharacterized protein n=1 Tax=Pontiella desulfatans TaxID=2750659 RepID=A0A6C2TZZ8_PONDE|nr:hypothetical protein [Pontiella desulfatans]VGO13242.1 hypothetical protein PDESU_01798 [Pontiella desulfatans]
MQPIPPDSFRETYGLTRGTKAMFIFGVVFFSVGLLASIALYFTPKLSDNSAPRWTWIACAACYALFVLFCAATSKMRNDHVDVTEEGITSHAAKGTTTLQWAEIAEVAESTQRGCLMLKANDGRKIRLEFQFENFGNLLDLVSLQLAAHGSNAKQGIYRKHIGFHIMHLLLLAFFGSLAAWSCMHGLYWGAAFLLFPLLSLKSAITEPLKVELHPNRIRISSLIKRRTIEMNTIRDIRLHPPLHGKGGLFIEISERGSDQTTKLFFFTGVFQLYQEARDHLELALPN